MPLPDHDAATGHSFGLEVDGVVIQNITDVSGLETEQDVIEVKENTANGRYAVRKLPGRSKAGECTLRRPLSEGNSFERFIKDSRLSGAEGARKSGSIIEF